MKFTRIDGKAGRSYGFTVGCPRIGWATGALPAEVIDDPGGDGATGLGAVPCGTVGPDEGFGCWKTQS